MPRLCVDARLYHESGIGTHLKAILPFLEQFELTLLVKEPLDLPARQIEMKSSIYSFQEQLELPRKIPSCDIFWSPHFNIPLLPIRAKKRVVTVHDLFHLAHFSTLSLAQKLYAKVVINAALRLSDFVMTDSHFSAEEIERYCFRPKNFEVVPSCCLLKPDPKKKMEGLPERYMLYVGNLKPHKNLKRLIEAHAQLDNPIPLVVVGKQFNEIELPDHVHYVGYLPDESLPGLYAGAELFLFPSTYEGFGIPPLEAMACGCPVVAGRAGALPEVCGDAVEFVDPFSTTSIKEGIERLLSDSARREELVKKGKERVKEYTPEKTAEKFINIVKRVHEGTGK
ncbi:MAG: glycosyltransferase family 4 protein [Chlamydiales bacterium]|nr:glycosyltransferase family 4 protein [Chlamydiales bacterium]